MTSHDQASRRAGAADQPEERRGEPPDPHAETHAGSRETSARGPARSSLLAPPDSLTRETSDPSWRSETDPGATPGGTDPFDRGAPPAKISRYVVLNRLGHGGMGIVYAAYDRELDRKIALKLLLDAGRGPEAHDRLLREAQALARISHPNVVSVHEVGYHERAIFIAMEYVTGVTLKRWLEDRRRSQAELIDVFTQAGRGLAAVHAAGIVHRDFKPGNFTTPRA